MLDHDILIKRLHDYASVGGKIALQSNDDLQGHTEQVKIDNVFFTSVSPTMGKFTRLGFGTYTVFHLHSSTLCYHRLVWRAIAYLCR